MGDAEFQEFVAEMFWRVIEGGGNELQHLAGTTLRDEPLSDLGPWDVRDCSLLLRQWLDAGLVSICLTEGWPTAPPPALPVIEAERLLDRSENWESETEAAGMTNRIFWVRASDAEWGRQPSPDALLDDWSRRVNREPFDEDSAANS
jgi:hypothetical protein